MYKTFKDRPQKGNPHQLKTNQHVFPVASIDRFYNDKEQVQVWRTGSKAPFPTKSKNPIFCADYAWDERSESGYMKAIEDNYQALIERFLKQPTAYQFTAEENEILTKLFGLWFFRKQAKDRPYPAQKVNGIVGLAQYPTVDESEQLEKNFVTQIYPDRVDDTYPNFDPSNPPNFYMTSQYNTGAMIQLRLMEFQEANEGAVWGVVIAKEGEFIVPDHYKWHAILPISPTICLVKDRVGIEFLCYSEVAIFNYHTREASDAFVFARDFTKAPILNTLYFAMKEAISTTFN